MKPQIEATRSPILIAEDESLIALNLQDIIEELGFAVVNTSRVAEALAAVEATPLCAAVLDYMLYGETTDPVAAALTARNIPYVVASGMDLDHMPALPPDRLLRKPYDFEGVRKAIAAMTPLRA